MESKKTLYIVKSAALGKKIAFYEEDLQLYLFL